MLGALFVYQDRRPLAYNVERFMRGARELPPKKCLQFEDVVKRVDHALMMNSTHEQTMEALRITDVAEYHLLLLRCALETYEQAGEALKDNERAFRRICSEALREWIADQVHYWKLDGEDMLLGTYETDQEFLDAYMGLWRESKKSPLDY